MTLDAISQCPNGRRGSLLSWQPAVPSFSPSIHSFDCSDSRTENSTTGSRNHLEARQTHFTCDANCSTECAPPPGSRYNADDCEALSGWMFQRNAQFPVHAGERIVLSWGTCMYAFNSFMPSTVTWCDAQWAQIGTYVARPCLANGSGGGFCRGEGFNVEITSNDNSTNTPVPYSATRTRPEATPLTIDLTPTPTTTSQYGSYNVPIAPVVGGVVGGAVFLLLVLACVFFTRRRSMKEVVPVASEETNKAARPTSAKKPQSLTVNTSRHNFSTLNSERTAVSSGDEQPTPTRQPTRQSTYTIEYDPFRSLRRAFSNQRRSGSLTPTPLTEIGMVASNKHSSS